MNAAANDPSEPLETPAPPSAPEPVDTLERRRCQRFIALRRGQPCFWVMFGEQRCGLLDLSLKGFSIPAALALPIGENFDFALVRDGVPDEIRGQAKVVNNVPTSDGGLAGCEFAVLTEADQARLQEWLVTHVIVSATVRITERDALQIVLGRSLV